eukprot:TRINITY_DN1634_c0_g1_i7.p1 TRINITY_DN1634_c0_g1~~TRINITY_DN1634_c0_g1_i7.p1  ORF type:complete len:310 (-),score=53.91 TRINITY_DN1634_c0_g1_i7:90-1019(-)
MVVRVDTAWRMLLGISQSQVTDAVRKAKCCNQQLQGTQHINGFPIHTHNVEVFCTRCSPKHSCKVAVATYGEHARTTSASGEELFFFNVTALCRSSKVHVKCSQVVLVFWLGGLRVVTSPFQTISRASRASGGGSRRSTAESKLVTLRQTQPSHGSSLNAAAAQFQRSTPWTSVYVPLGISVAVYLQRHYSALYTFPQGVQLLFDGRTIMPPEGLIGRSCCVLERCTTRVALQRARVEAPNVGAGDAPLDSGDDDHWYSLSCATYATAAQAVRHSAVRDAYLRNVTRNIFNADLIAAGIFTTIAVFTSW